MSTRSKPSETAASGESIPLRVTLSIEPSAELSCAVLELGVDGEEVKQDTICRDGCESGCSCRAEVSVTRDGHTDRQFVKGTVEENCICPIFRRNDCIAEIQAVQSGSLIVGVTISDRSALKTVFQKLKATGATVDLRQIRELDDKSSDRILEIDTESITDKQREAVEAAHEAGYYDKPRRATLDDLADQLGISCSAVSQRLNAAETTLIDALYELDSSTDRP